MLDRLVGYNLSPILWKKVAPGLSAGRVQSVAVRLIVERQKEIDAFKSEEYWTISANVEALGTEFKSSLTSYKNKKINIKNEAEANEITEYDTKKGKFIIKDLEKEIENSTTTI